MRSAFSASPCLLISRDRSATGSWARSLALTRLAADRPKRNRQKRLFYPSPRAARTRKSFFTPADTEPPPEKAFFPSPTRRSEGKSLFYLSRDAARTRKRFFTSTDASSAPKKAFLPGPPRGSTPKTLFCRSAALLRPGNEGFDPCPCPLFDSAPKARPNIACGFNRRTPERTKPGKRCKCVPWIAVNDSAPRFRRA